MKRVDTADLEHPVFDKNGNFVGYPSIPKPGWPYVDENDVEHEVVDVMHDCLYEIGVARD